MYLHNNKLFKNEQEALLPNHSIVLLNDGDLYLFQVLTEIPIVLKRILTNNFKPSNTY